MSQRAELLELERRKLSLLRNKVKEQEARVRTLEAMEDDPFDILLEQELAADTTAQKAISTANAAVQASALVPAGQMPAPVQTSAQPSATPAPSPFPSDDLGAVFTWKRKLRRMPDTWVRLLTFIGKEGKDYESVKAFIDENNLPIGHGAARTQLMNYRRDFGFVENPRKGFYVATERALEFIRELPSGQAAVSNLAA